MVKALQHVDYTRKVASEFRALERSKSVCTQNKELIKSFIRDCYAEQLSHARVSKYINLLKQIALRIQKPFREVTLEDLKALLQEVELADYSAWTKRDYRIGIRKFWKWLDGGEDHPAIVRWIKTTVSGRKLKLPSDLLTEEEIQRLLESAEHPRDRALISLLWETGCRAGELLTLRVKSFKERDEICFIDVTGKTGSRRIPVVASVPHLTRWLSFHPRRDDPESPMWMCLRASDREKFVKYGALSQRLRRIAQKAGIKKRVHPHLFRHSRATFLASRLTESQMKYFFGWIQGSEMASTYVHLSGRDIQDSILTLYGKGKEQKSAEPHISIKTCPRCGYNNASDLRLCDRCGSPTSLSEAMALSKRMRIYDGLLTSLMSDERVVGILDRKLAGSPGLVKQLRDLLEQRENHKEIS